MKLINILLLTFTFGFPGLPSTFSTMVEGEEAFITTAIKKGVKRARSPGIRPLERTRSLERAERARSRSLSRERVLLPPVKEVRFKKGIPSDRVALIIRARDTGKVSFQIKNDVEISMAELQLNSPLSKEIMEKYKLDKSDAEAVNRAFERVKTGTSSGSFNGDPPTPHISPAVLRPSIKRTDEKFPIKNYEDAQMAFYGSLKRALDKVDRPSYRKDPKFARDALDKEAARDLEDLGVKLRKKYHSRQKFTDRDRRKLKYLLDENGYLPPSTSHLQEFV